MLHAEIRTDDGTPVLVTVDGRSANVPHRPEAPGAAIRTALGYLGYEPSGSFTRLSDLVTVVDVRSAPLVR